MNIRNREAFMDSLWDWSILNGCFRCEDGYNGIRPKDLDGTVERNGFFLHFEGKPSDKALEAGEIRYITQRVGKSLYGVDTFLVVWGQPPLGPVDMFEVWYPGGHKARHRHGLEKLRQFVTEWFRRADRGAWRWEP